MTATGDGDGEMAPMWLVDDETIEALVRGDEVAAPFAALATVTRGLQAAGEGPAPIPSPELQALLSGAAPILGIADPHVGAVDGAVADGAEAPGIRHNGHGLNGHRLNGHGADGVTLNGHRVDVPAIGAALDGSMSAGGAHGAGSVQGVDGTVADPNPAVAPGSTDATVVALPLAGRRQGDSAGAPAAAGPAHARRRPRRRSLAGRVAVGASVAVAGVVAIAGAGAAGVLPDAVRTVVEFVSPVDPPSPKTDHDPAVPTGADGSSDGRGSPTTTPSGTRPATPSSGADPATGTPATPADPATPGIPAPAADGGLDQAGDTPAEPHLPTTPPPSTAPTVPATAPGATAPSQSDGAPGDTAPGTTAPTRSGDTPGDAVTSR